MGGLGSDTEGLGVTEGEGAGTGEGVCGAGEGVTEGEGVTAGEGEWDFGLTGGGGLLIDDFFLATAGGCEDCLLPGQGPESSLAAGEVGGGSGEEEGSCVSATGFDASLSSLTTSTAFSCVVLGTSASVLDLTGAFISVVLLRLVGRGGRFTGIGLGGGA